MSPGQTQPDQDNDLILLNNAIATATVNEQYALSDDDERTGRVRTDSLGVTNTNYTVTAGSRLVAVDGSQFTYDNDGQRSSDDRFQYVYDAFGRLVEIRNATDSSLLSAFEYDPLGRMDAFTENANIFSIEYFDQHAVQYLDNNNQVVKHFINHSMVRLPIGELNTQGNWFHHYDGHGNLVVISNDVGQQAERYRYSAFGEVLFYDANGNVQLANSAIGVHPMFAATRRDPNSGLYLPDARCYDPVTGLYLSRDPFLHIAGPNPYLYARHAPYLFVDPTGTIPPLIVAGLVVGAAGAVVGMGSVLLSDEPYDVWDVLAAGAIGFGAGFIGGVTFGAVAPYVGSMLLPAAAASTGMAGAGIGVNLVAGSIAGGASGLASGVFSGSAGGAYQAYRRDGDMF